MLNEKNNTTKKMLIGLLEYPYIIYKDGTCVHKRNVNNKYLSSFKLEQLRKYPEDFVCINSHEEFTIFFCNHLKNKSVFQIIIFYPDTILVPTIIDFLQKKITIITNILDNKILPLYHSDTTKEKKLYSINTQDIDFINNTYVEQIILKFLKAKDYNSAYTLMKKLSASSSSKLSKDNLTSNKYKLICFITIITRTVILYGYPITSTYHLSDELIYEVDSISSEYDLEPFIKKMFKQYIDYFTKNSIESSSYIVKLVNEYVESNLFKPITNQEIADYVGLSYAYLSTSFKKETNTTLRQFIQEKKIEEAKFLLSHTDLSIEKISYKLSFCNQSYFSKTFKKIVHRTPYQYRYGFHIS